MACFLSIGGLDKNVSEIRLQEKSSGKLSAVIKIRYKLFLILLVFWPVVSAIRLLVDRSHAGTWERSG